MKLQPYLPARLDLLLDSAKLQLWLAVGASVGTQPKLRSRSVNLLEGPNFYHDWRNEILIEILRTANVYRPLNQFNTRGTIMYVWKILHKIWLVL